MAYVVGLTGGIGSGKSAAADEFGRLGATLVDTDAIAHHLTRRGGAAMQQIRELFGDGVVAADGSMDRKKVREMVFADPAARARLEGVLHPLIREESARLVQGAAGPYVVLVVPLLIESAGYRNRVHRVLVVDCDAAAQLARVVARSGLAPQEVKRIIAAQVSRAERVAAADDIIDNSGTLAALQQQVSSLHLRYLDLAHAEQTRPRS